MNRESDVRWTLGTDSRYPWALDRTQVKIHPWALDRTQVKIHPWALDRTQVKIHCARSYGPIQKERCNKSLKLGLNHRSSYQNVGKACINPLNHIHGLQAKNQCFIQRIPGLWQVCNLRCIHACVVCACRRNERRTWFSNTLRCSYFPRGFATSLKFCLNPQLLTNSGATRCFPF